MPSGRPTQHAYATDRQSRITRDDPSGLMPVAASRRAAHDVYKTAALDLAWSFAQAWP